MLKLLITLLYISTIQCQQMQWILLSDGSGMDSPMPRRDAALGFDSQYLILYGGRDQAGMPLQDSYAFNVAIGKRTRMKETFNALFLQANGNDLIFLIHLLHVMEWPRPVQLEVDCTSLVVLVFKERHRSTIPTSATDHQD